MIAVVVTARERLVHANHDELIGIGLSHDTGAAEGIVVVVEHAERSAPSGITLSMV
jgi:hypothetical protein